MPKRSGSKHIGQPEERRSLCLLDSQPGTEQWHLDVASTIVTITQQLMFLPSGTRKCENSKSGRRVYLQSCNLQDTCTLQGRTHFTRTHPLQDPLRLRLHPITHIFAHSLDRSFMMFSKIQRLKCYPNTFGDDRLRADFHGNHLLAGGELQVYLGAEFAGEKSALGDTHV